MLMNFDYIHFQFDASANGSNIFLFFLISLSFGFRFRWSRNCVTVLLSAPAKRAARNWNEKQSCRWIKSKPELFRQLWLRFVLLIQGALQIERLCESRNHKFEPIKLGHDDAFRVLWNVITLWKINSSLAPQLIAASNDLRSTTIRYCLHKRRTCRFLIQIIEIVVKLTFYTRQEAADQTFIFHWSFLINWLSWHSKIIYW